MQNRVICENLLPLTDWTTLTSCIGGSATQPSNRPGSSFPEPVPPGVLPFPKPPKFPPIPPKFAYDSNLMA
jgi:hypothetical protein